MKYIEKKSQASFYIRTLITKIKLELFSFNMDLKDKRSLRKLQRNDKLTLFVRKIHNILQSKYRFIKYEKYRKRKAKRHK